MPFPYCARSAFNLSGSSGIAGQRGRTLPLWGNCRSESLRQSGCQQLETLASNWTASQPASTSIVPPPSSGPHHRRWPDASGRRASFRLRDWKWKVAVRFGHRSFAQCRYSNSGRGGGSEAASATGLVSAAVHVSGSLESPLVTSEVTIENLAAPTNTLRRLAPM